MNPENDTQVCVVADKCNVELQSSKIKEDLCNYIFRLYSICSPAITLGTCATHWKLCGTSLSARLSFTLNDNHECHKPTKQTVQNFMKATYA